MSAEALERLREERRVQAAHDRFVASLTAGYHVSRVRRARCKCGAVAKGRPQHSERHGELSIQRRKCHVCGVIYVCIVD